MKNEQNKPTLNLELVRKVQESAANNVTQALSASSDQALHTSLNIIFKDVSVYRDKRYNPTSLIRTSQNTVKVISEEELICKAAVEFLSAGILLQKTKLETAVATWLLTARQEPVYPKAFTTSIEEIGFSYLDISEIQKRSAEAPSDLSFPTWQAFLNTMPSDKARISFQAYIWLIVSGVQDNHQWLAFTGAGGNGKSSVIEFIERLLGEDACGVIRPGDEYNVAALEGKRFAAMSELNNSKYALSSEFKSITGNDTVMLKQKFEKNRAVRLDVKVLATTNKQILVGSAQAERRRLIQIDLAPVKQLIPNFKQKLWEERIDFLASCQLAFNKAYDTTTKMIECDYEIFDEAAAFSEEREQYLAEKYFSFKEGAQVSTNDFQEAIEAAGLRDEFKIAAFVDYLKRTYNVKKERKTVKGVRSYFYVGMSLKQTSEVNHSAKIASLKNFGGAK